MKRFFVLFVLLSSVIGIAKAKNDTYLLTRNGEMYEVSVEKITSDKVFFVNSKSKKLGVQSLPKDFVYMIKTEGKNSIFFDTDGNQCYTQKSIEVKEDKEDVVYLMAGGEMIVYQLMVDKEYVKFKLKKSKSAPIQTYKKSEVFMIHHADGNYNEVIAAPYVNKDVTAQSKTPEQPQPAQVQVQGKSKKGKGQTLKTTFRTALIFAYSSVNNIYEDENVKLEIYDEKLWATNKTQKTLFIDLSQCFLYHNNVSRPMFTKDEKDNKASKKGVTTSVDEFITVAPSTGQKQNETYICSLSSRFYGNYTTTESPSGDFTQYDKRLLNLINELVEESLKADPNKKVCKGTVHRHLTEDESVNNIGASIAYAFNKRSENWTTVNMTTWVCDVIFAPYYNVIPKELSKKEKVGFSIKETPPAEIHVRADSPFEMEADKSPLVVTNWSGDFKRGTFTLGSTRISKTTGVGAAMAASLLIGPDALALINEKYYKRVVCFDGANADWGVMEYSNFSDSFSLTQRMR